MRLRRNAPPSAFSSARDTPCLAAQHQVLIDVHAAGVTYPDVPMTRGAYQLKPEPPFIPGSEVAGVVRAAPAGSAFEVGDRVVAFP